MYTHIHVLVRWGLTLAKEDGQDQSNILFCLNLYGLGGAGWGSILAFYTWFTFTMFCYCCGDLLAERRYRLSSPSHESQLAVWQTLFVSRMIAIH